MSYYATRMKVDGIVMVVCAIISGSAMIWFDYQFMQPIHTLKDDPLTNIGVPIVVVGIIILILIGFIESRR